MKRSKEPTWLKNAKESERLPAWDLWKHRDYYPAEAMDSESCTHNGLIGNCGADCPCYIYGKCPIEGEIDEACERLREAAKPLKLTV